MGILGFRVLKVFRVLSVGFWNKYTLYVPSLEGTVMGLGRRMLPYVDKRCISAGCLATLLSGLGLFRMILEGPTQHWSL